MRKGKILEVALVAVALILLLTGNWGAALFLGIFAQLGRIAAMLIERRLAARMAAAEELRHQ